MSELNQHDGFSSWLFYHWLPGHHSDGCQFTTCKPNGILVITLLKSSWFHHTLVNMVKGLWWKPIILSWLCTSFREKHNHVFFFTYGSMLIAKIPWIVTLEIQTCPASFMILLHVFYAPSSWCGGLAACALWAALWATCHDSSAVVACAKFCADLNTRNEITMIEVLFWIWKLCIKNC